MINAQELRQGNLLQDKYTGKFIPVLEILRNGNIVFDFETTEKWQAVPIQLTKELLTKNCGFVQRGDGNLYDLLYMQKLPDGKEIEKTFTVGAPSDCFVIIQFNHIHIKYLHTLQNAFALTGQELEVNL